jgi:CRP-like cAMP-binding protein
MRKFGVDFNEVWKMGMWRASKFPRSHAAQNKWKRRIVRSLKNMNETTRFSGCGEQPSGSPSALVRKLDRLIELDNSQREYLESLQRNIRHLNSGDDLIQRGQVYDAAFVIRSGWAMRYRMLQDGRRQILSFALPGDFLGLSPTFKRTSGHAIAALTDIETAALTADQIDAMYRDQARLSAALNWAAARDYAMLAEQVVRLGRQTAYERTAHLILELWERLRIVDMTQDHNFVFPFTQEEIADTLGLSTVHVNRTLKRLRQEGLISVARHRVIIHDVHQLRRIAEYDFDYLNDFVTI